MRAFDQASVRLTFRHEILVSVGCCAATDNAFERRSIDDRNGTTARKIERRRFLAIETSHLTIAAELRQAVRF
jgi:hypothetical protein